MDPSVDEVLPKLDPLPPGLTVLVEPSDNIGGGAPGDGTGLLRALVERRIPNAAIAINDPEAVATALAARRRCEDRRFRIGGRGSRLDAGPVHARGRVAPSRRREDFELEDKQSHLASMAGDPSTWGRAPSSVTAV